MTITDTKIWYMTKDKEINVASNDETIISGANNHNYMYSVNDVHNIAIKLRQKYLNYEGRDEPQDGNNYSALRGNNNQILLLDAYALQNLQNGIEDDVDKIIGEGSGTKWNNPPQTILIPFLTAAHWISIKIDINYDDSSASLLWDNPYGLSYETGEYQVAGKTISGFGVIANVRSAVERLMKHYLHDTEFTLIGDDLLGNWTLNYQHMDQQGLEIDGVSCGTITLRNIEDYLDTRVNHGQSLPTEYTIPEYKGNIIQNRAKLYAAKKEHVKMYASITGVEIFETESITTSNINDNLLSTDINVEITEEPLLQQQQAIFINKLKEREDIGDRVKLPHKQTIEDFTKINIIEDNTSYEFLKKEKEEFDRNYSQEVKDYSLNELLQMDESKVTDQDIEKASSKFFKMIREIKVLSRDKITELKKLDYEEHGNLLKKIAYKKDSESLTKLIKLIDNIGQFYLDLGKLSGDPQYLTDSAIFYNNIISMAKEKLTNTPSIDTGKFYTQLTIIQQELFKLIGSNSLTKDIEAESQENKSILEELRKDTEAKLEAIEEYRLKLKQNESHISVQDFDNNENSGQPNATNENIKNERLIFENIAKNMQSFLAKLYVDAEKEMEGPPPCEYAVIGMGSMALKQITPHSDIEFAIIVEKYTPEIIAYFRNMTHLVHFKMINLGETIIPTSKYGVDVSHFTNRAVNFDLGGKTPLNRIDQDKEYDLIGTIDWLIRYVRNEGDEKIRGEARDKALPYMLEKVCYVYGNEELVNSYKHNVTKFLQEEYKGTEEKYHGLKQHQVRALKILEEGSIEFNYSTHKIYEWKGDVEKLRPNLANAEGKSFDVKQEIYRLPDRMIYNLGLYYGIEGDSAWDTIDKLQQKKIINATAAANLKEAVTFATTLRLKTYLHNKSQTENMSLFAQPAGDSIELKEQLSNIFYLNQDELKEGGNFFRYFYIVLPLHKQLEKLCENDRKELNFEKNMFYNDEAGVKGLIYYRLQNYELARQHLERAINTDSVVDQTIIQVVLGIIFSFQGNDNEAIKTLQKCSNQSANAINIGTNEKLAEAVLLTNLGNAYLGVMKLDNAKNCYLKALSIRKQIYEINHPDIAISYNCLGNLFMIRKSELLAIKYFVYSIVQYSNGVLNSNINPEEVMGDLLNDIKLMPKVIHDILSFNIWHKTGSHELVTFLVSASNLAMALKQLGFYEESLNVSLKLISTYTTIYKGEPNIREAGVLNNIATIYKIKGDLKFTIKLYEKALVSYRIIHNEKPNINEAGIYRNIGDIYKIQGDFNKAYKYYQKAFQFLSQIEENFLSPIYCDFVSSYADLLYVIGKFKEASIYYSSELAILLDNVDKHSFNAIDLGLCMSKLALSLIADRNNEKANQYFNDTIKIVDILEKNVETTKLCYSSNLSFLIILENLGVFSRVTGNHKLAIKYHLKSLDTIDYTATKIPKYILVSLYKNLGLSYLYMGMYEEAKQHLNISASFLSVDSKFNILQAASVSYNLGELSYKQNQFEEAKSHFESCLNIYRKFDFVPLEKIKAVLLQLMLANIELKKEDVALEYFREMLKCEQFYVKMYNNKIDINTANNLNRVGHIFFSQGIYKEAVKNFLESLQIKEILYKEDASLIIKIISTSNIIGETYNRLEQYNKAKEYLLRAKALCMLNIEGNEKLLASIFLHIGNTYKELKQYKESLENYEESYKYYDKSLEGQAKALEGKAAVYEEQNALEDAKKNYAKALQLKYEFYKPSLNRSHFDIAITENNIGKVCVALKNYEEAKNHYDNAIRTYELYYGSTNHPYIAATLNNIGEMYQCQSMYNLSLGYFSKAKYNISAFPSSSYLQIIESNLENMVEIFSTKNSLNLNIVNFFIEKEMDFLDFKKMLEDINGFDIEFDGIGALIKLYETVIHFVPISNSELCSFVKKSIIELSSVNMESFRLWQAAKNNDLTGISEIILGKEKGKYDLDILIQGVTPLVNAIGHNNLEMIELLVEQGADLNKPVQSKATPLYCSLGYYGQEINMSIVELLLENKANVNLGMDDGDTPMHMACYKARVDLMEKLLCYGANINIINGEGKTPIYVVIETKGYTTVEQRLSSVIYLFANGANFGNHSMNDILELANTNLPECLDHIKKHFGFIQQDSQYYQMNIEDLDCENKSNEVYLDGETVE